MWKSTREIGWRCLEDIMMQNHIDVNSKETGAKEAFRLVEGLFDKMVPLKMTNVKRPAKIPEAQIKQILGHIPKP